MTPTEVARALRALSSTYVERRARLAGRGAFDTAGKRAAYALYYAPRRYLTLSHVLRMLDVARGPTEILDLGCGTGAAGAAWASYAGPGSTMLGLDVHPWALEETRATCRAFGVHGQVRRAPITGDRASAGIAGPGPRDGVFAARAIVVSYLANELSAEARDALLPTLLAAAGRGARVLVMEPLSRRTSPWWNTWARQFEAAGGRSDEWRLRIEPPPLTKALGRAAGLDPVEVTARSLWR